LHRTRCRSVHAEARHGEFEVHPEVIDTARKLTFATLLGMAIQGMLGSRKPRFSREIETLKQSVLHMLELEDAG
jgi:hypothetical protein